MTETVDRTADASGDSTLPPQVENLLEKLEEGLPKGEVPASLFGHPQVYQTELRNIFGRCWVFLAHESEIAANGDYVVRRIGEDNFIVSRDEQGEIHVLFDADRKSTRLNSSHANISYAVFCLKKKT